MKIKSKIKNLTEFIFEMDSNKTQKIKVQSTDALDLGKEIDSILNNLQDLEINLNKDIYQQNNSKDIKESVQPIYEETESYQKGFDKGEKFAAAVGAVLLVVYLKQRAKKRIKKKQAAYTKYWPAKSKLEIDKSYSDKNFDLDFNKEEFIEKELTAIKDKINKKLDKLDQTTDKGKKIAGDIRQKRDEKIKKVEELLNKKIDQKKERLKLEIDRKIEDLDLKWKRDDADTNIASLFSKISGNPAGGKMERKWQDWKFEFDRKTEDQMIDYERSVIDKINGDDDEQLQKDLKGLDDKIKKAKEEHALAKKKSSEENAKLNKEEKELEAKEKAKETQYGDEYVKAKGKYSDFMQSISRFGSSLAFAEKNTSGSGAEKAKQDLTKSWKNLQMRSNFSKADAKELMPDGNDKKYEELLKDRKEQMSDFKKSYNETISKFKNVEKPADKPTKEKPTKENESLNVKFTEKLLNFNEF